MIVKELIEKLQNMDPDAHVVIDGEVVDGVEQRVGRFRKEYMNNRFTFINKGKHNALVFTKLTEFSDGTVGLDII